MGKKNNYGYITLIDNDTNTSQTFKIKDIFDNCLEYEKGIINVDNTTHFFDTEKGTIHYFTGITSFTRQEINSLLILRRNVALKNIFNVKKNDEFDYFKLIPYLIIVLLILI